MLLATALLTGWTGEVVEACAKLVAAQWPRLAGTLLAVVAAAGVEARLGRASARLRAGVFGAVLGAATAVGLWLGLRKAWLCDDAFITFRYAWNLAHGNGLVFNPGEWVEGYTNFLWAALLGALGRAGADIPYSALFLNALAFAAVLALAALAVLRASPRQGPGAVAVPWASVVLAGSAAFTTWATSGLETMPAIACVMAAVWLVASEARPWAVGLALAAAALTRPDHLLFAPAMGAAFVAEDLLHGAGPWFGRLRWRRWVELAAPVALTFGPYWLLRWHVYGDPFPNTYYAKSGGDSYAAQGWVYLTHFLCTTGAWLGAPLLAWLALSPPRHRTDTALRTFAVAAAALLGGYVVRVGGDFMEHRFLLVLLPVAAVAVEVSLRRRLAAGGGRKPLSWGPAVAGLALAAVALLPVRPIGPFEKRWHLAAEETFYAVTGLFPLVIGDSHFEMAHRLAEAFPQGSGLSPRLAEGNVGFVSYYSKLPVVDELGLTSRRVAHKPLAGRGRPGHEKVATLEDLLEEGADIADNPVWPGRANETKLDLPGLPFAFVRYDARVAARARAMGGTAADPVADIRRLASLRRRADVLDWRGFYREYLSKLPDRARLLVPFDAALGEVADFESGLPPGSLAEGGVAVATGTCPRGASGHGWLTVASGRLSIPIPTGATEVRFALGGHGAASVRLETPSPDGKPRTVQNVSPVSKDELLPVAWPLEPPAPTGMWLVAQGGPGAALLVDSVHVPSAPQVSLLGEPSALSDAERFELLRSAEEEFPPDDARLRRLRDRLSARWTFDGARLGDDVQTAGTAFARTDDGTLAGQLTVIGKQGERFINGFARGDAATGRLTLRLPRARHLAVGALLGGGSDCAHVFLALEVNGAFRHRACGQNDEVLRPVVFETDVEPEDTVRLVAVDDATGGWGHLLLDDVQVVARDPASAGQRPAPGPR